MEIDWSTLDPTSFEELCFELLKDLGFINTRWCQGPADKGRDIECCQLVNLPDGKLRLDTWYVECKFSRTGRAWAQEEFYKNVQWAEEEQVGTLLIVTNSHLSNQARDWFQALPKKKPFAVHLWENKDLEQLLAERGLLRSRFFRNLDWASLLKASKRQIEEEIETSVGRKYLPGLYILRGVEADLENFVKRSRASELHRARFATLQSSLADCVQRAQLWRRTVDARLGELLDSSTSEVLQEIESALISSTHSVSNIAQEVRRDFLNRLKTATSPADATLAARLEEALATVEELTPQLCAGPKRAYQRLVDECALHTEITSPEETATTMLAGVKELEGSWHTTHREALRLLKECSNRLTGRKSDRRHWLRAKIHELRDTELRTFASVDRERLSPVVRSASGSQHRAIDDAVDTAVLIRKLLSDQLSGATRLADSKFWNELAKCFGKKRFRQSASIGHARKVTEDQALYDTLFTSRRSILEKLDSLPLSALVSRTQDVLQEALSMCVRLTAATDGFTEALGDLPFWKQRAAMLIDRAGSGKTNLLCHLAIEFASTFPTVFLTGRSLHTGGDDLFATITAQLLRHVQARGQEASLSDVENLLEEQDSELLVFIDAINETSDIPSFDRSLRRLFPQLRRKRVLFLMSCRDVFWQFFDGGKWEELLGLRFENRLYEYDEEEYALAVDRYFSRYHVRGELKGKAWEDCRHPLLLRFFCEAYQSKRIGEVDEIRLKDLFDYYWESKIRELASRMGLGQDGSIAESALYSMVRELHNQRAKSLERSRVKDVCGFDDMETAASLYQRILDEDIILEERIDPYSLGRRVSFVYEAFMEYALARQLFGASNMRSLEEGDLIQMLRSLAASARQYGNLYGAMDFLLLMILEERDLHLWGELVEHGQERRRWLSRSLRLIPLERVDERSVAALEAVIRNGQGGGKREESVLEEAAGTLRRLSGAQPELCDEMVKSIMFKSDALTKKKIVWLAKFSGSQRFLRQLSGFFSSNYRLVEKETFKVLEEAGALDYELLQGCLESRYIFVRERAQDLLEEIYGISSRGVS